MKTTLASFLVITAAALSVSPVGAADLSAPAPVRAAPAPAADKLASARALVAARQWPAAIDELRRVNETGSADWNNLMGYSLRKGQTPDLAGSERHYAEALRIDPKHRNALEYSGELFLMKGELDKAEARLTTLATVCAAGCEQHAELKTAIEKYKAAGNRYIASW
jgi:Flp pilus assembly protein TadD